FCGACGNNRTNRGGFQFAAARLPWFFPAPMMRSLGFVPVETAYTQRANEDEPGFLQIVYRRS
ncbi:hypothetical protein, partial [Escherichia coli]|uniref:hypothetical protein n=1 Tax=Escherichia coli TaxID=562 RepID=UPI0021A3DAA5